MTGRAGDGQCPLRLGQHLGQAVARPQPDVEQGAGVVDRRSGDPADAGEAQQQRRRQQGLVERGEQHGLVDPAELLDQRVEVLAAHRRGGVHRPRAGPGQDVPDAGQQAPGRGAGGAAEQRHLDVRDRPDGRPGQQHVTGAVEAGDEDTPGHRTDVADHCRSPRCDTQVRCGGEHHSGAGLTAGTAVLGAVRADLPGVERAQQLLDAGVHGVGLRPGDQAARDAGLIGHHSGGYPGVAEQSERGEGRWNGCGEGRITVVGDVEDERAVPVEQDGGRSRGVGHP